MDTFPDLGSLSDQELKDLIQQLTDEELEISYRRRILHGKIDILRAELVNRLRKKHEGGEEVITGADVQRLTDILAGRAPATAERATSEEAPRRGPALPRVRVRQRRGRELLPALRRVPRRARRAAARAARPRPTASMRPASSMPVDARATSSPAAAALVDPLRRRPRRASASRWRATGMTIGRRPTADVFLDDVTVSRDHALLVRRGERLLPRRPPAR